MGGFESVCWILTILGTVVAGLFLAGALFASNGAPQEAAAAALAAAFAVVPYVFTRAIQAMGRDRRERSGIDSQGTLTRVG
jgi:ABC-type phosphate transport system permease subunit